MGHNSHRNLPNIRKECVDAEFWRVVPVGFIWSKLLLFECALCHWLFCWILLEWRRGDDWWFSLDFVATLTTLAFKILALNSTMMWRRPLRRFFRMSWVWSCGILAGWSWFPLQIKFGLISKCRWEMCAMCWCTWIAATSSPTHFPQSTKWDCACIATFCCGQRRTGCRTASLPPLSTWLPRNARVCVELILLNCHWFVASGESINRSMLKSLVGMWEVIGGVERNGGDAEGRDKSRMDSTSSTPLSVYQQDFEVRFLESSASLYRERSAKWLMEASVPHFLTQVFPFIPPLTRWIHFFTKRLKTICKKKISACSTICFHPRPTNYNACWNMSCWGSIWPRCWRCRCQVWCACWMEIETKVRGA